MSEDLDLGENLTAVKDFVKENKGMVAAIAAIALTLFVILITEINSTMTLDARANTALAGAKTLEDYVRIREEFRGTRMEPQILVEKLMFLLRERDGQQPDYKAAKEVLDELYSEEHKNWADSVPCVIWAGMMRQSVIDNLQFEEGRAAEMKNKAAAPQPEKEKTEEPKAVEDK